MPITAILKTNMKQNIAAIEQASIPETIDQLKKILEMKLIERNDYQTKLNKSWGWPFEDNSEWQNKINLVDMEIEHLKQKMQIKNTIKLLAI